MLKNCLVLLAFLCTSGLFAQENPVKWSFEVKPLGGADYELIFHANIEDGWATYSQHLESDEGPIATAFAFKPSDSYELVGDVAEAGDIKSSYDPLFEMTLTKIKHKGTFTQKVKVKDASKAITGYVTFMCCNDEMCLPPKDVDFSFSIVQ